MPTKVAINKCYGGFSISEAAIQKLKELDPVKYKDIEEFDFNSEKDRTDPGLIQVIEALGELANGAFAEIKIVEIPDDCPDWYIHDYDGIESVNEAHRSWH